jgi:hypothetical protein
MLMRTLTSLSLALLHHRVRSEHHVVARRAPVLTAEQPTGGGAGDGQQRRARHHPGQAGTRRSAAINAQLGNCSGRATVRGHDSLRSPRRTMRDAQSGIGRQIEPDGRQPRELERTRAWVFNLTAFLHLARFGERLGVDLWNHQTADGRSLRRAIDYLLPFAARERPFPHQQITQFNPATLHPVLRRAAVGLNEPRYRELAQHIGGATSRLQLTLP